MSQETTISAIDKSKNQWGLSAFQLKIIGIICMTLDHIVACGFEIPWIEANGNLFRTFGRIAAPIFLFVLIQSIHHTRSKMKLLLRLYFAGVTIGLFDLAVNVLASKTLGLYTPGVIMFDFFYVTLYIIIIEKLVVAVKTKHVQSIFILLCVTLLSLIPSIFFDFFSHVFSAETLELNLLLKGLRASIIPSFYDANYGIGIILLGILLYFCKSKRMQCFAFGAFCLICIVGAFLAMRYTAVSIFSFYGFTEIYFDLLQCRMVLALPFIALYNGERGEPCKWIFYWYYPLHRQILHILFAIVS